MSHILLARVAKIFREDLALKAVPHKEDDLRQDYGMDEDDFDTLATSLRVEFDLLNLEDETVTGFRTFGDVLAYLESTIPTSEE